MRVQSYPSSPSRPDFKISSTMAPPLRFSGVVTAKPELNNERTISLLGEMMDVTNKRLQALATEERIIEFKRINLGHQRYYQGFLNKKQKIIDRFIERYIGSQDSEKRAAAKYLKMTETKFNRQLESGSLVPGLTPFEFSVLTVGHELKELIEATTGTPYPEFEDIPEPFRTQFPLLLSNKSALFHSAKFRNTGNDATFKELSKPYLTSHGTMTPQFRKELDEAQAFVEQCHRNTFGKPFNMQTFLSYYTNKLIWRYRFQDSQDIAHQCENADLQHFLQYGFIKPQAQPLTPQ